jgi:putative transposase
LHNILISIAASPPTIKEPDNSTGASLPWGRFQSAHGSVLQRRLHYVWTAEGWLYVAVVIDLFSRRVVGWSMSSTMTAHLVTDALVMVIWRRGKPLAVLHHSDRGSQYSSEQFQRLVAELGVTCSMSRSGNVWDNAAMESFFSSLKTERIRGRIYRTRDQARANVFDYIERFYNPRRRHSTIGYLSPMDFEALAEER